MEIAEYLLSHGQPIKDEIDSRFLFSDNSDESRNAFLDELSHVLAVNLNKSYEEVRSAVDYDIVAKLIRGTIEHN